MRTLPVFLALVLACVSPGFAGLITFDLFTIPAATVVPPLNLMQSGVGVGIGTAGGNIQHNNSGMGNDLIGGNAINATETLIFSITSPLAITSFNFTFPSNPPFTNAAQLFSGSDAFSVVINGGGAIAVTPAATPGDLWTSPVFPNVTTINVTGTAGVFRLRTLQLNQVPEPGTYALVGLGLVGLALLRRRRKA